MAVEDRLKSYFSDSARTAGLRSSHGALVDRARQGQRGTSSPREPEDGWSGRNTHGDGKRGLVRGHAEVAQALRKMDRHEAEVLLAYYGTPPWPGPCPNQPDRDDGLDEDERGKPKRGRKAVRRETWTRSLPPPEVRLALGEQLGRVALLTEKLAEQFERPDYKASTPARLLEQLCMAGGATCRAVEAEAQHRHRAALYRICQLLNEKMTKERKRRPPDPLRFVWHAPPVQKLVGVKP